MSSIFRIPRTLVKRLIISTRHVAQDPCSSKPKKDFEDKIRKWAFNVSGYNKYGLYTDDIIDDQNSVVREALRRLPKDVLDVRNFRIIRALHLNFLKIYLPRENWITYEQDLEYRYLRPYIQEIVAERTEISEFGCVNYSEDDWPAHEIK